MKTLLLVLVPAFAYASGNTCTLNKLGVCAGGTCNYSATTNTATGNPWSGTGCSGTGYLPSQDNISIAAGVTLTIDTNNTVLGTAGAPIYGYVYGVNNTTPATGCTATCTATVSGGTTTGLLPATAKCTVSSGTATISLNQRGLYAVGSATPTVAVTGTNCGSGTYSLNFEPGGGTAAIQMTGTSSVIIAAGASLTARGAIAWSTSGDTVGASSFTMKRGSSLAFSPGDRNSNTMYTLGASAISDHRIIDLSDGTAAQPITVTTNAGGIPGMIAGMGYNVATGFKATFVNFSNIGDASTPVMHYVPTSASLPYIVTDSTFNNCGTIKFSTNVGATNIVQHDRNLHTNSVAGAGGDTLLSIITTTAITSGVHEILNNSFDTAPNASGGADFVKDFTINNNIFNNCVAFASPSTTNAWASFDTNFIRCTDTANGIKASGDTNHTYFFEDTSQANLHIFTASHSNLVTHSNGVYELSHSTGGDSGEFVTSIGQTNINHIVKLPDDSGQAWAELASIETGTGFNFNHNFFWGRFPDVGSGTGIFFGPIQFNEASQSSSSAVSMQDNILYSDLTGRVGYFKSETINTTTITNADVCNPCSYNAAYNYTIPYNTCTACANVANGYGGKWSAGWHTTNSDLDLDISNPDDTVGPGSSGRVNPRLADSTRQLATFASRYLGKTATHGTWVGTTTYAYGDIVTYTVSGIYWGLPVLYRCIVQPTCATGSTAEPSVGATWRNNWELASLYFVRTLAPLGTAWGAQATDGATGCVGCSITQALTNWVRTGFTPQNVKLRGGAHDGSTIGPMPMLRIPSFPSSQ